MIYKDRIGAGKALVKKLDHYMKSSCVVIGLPNGGIPVGLEIATELKAVFDLLFISKITPRFNSEIGYGSVSEYGTVQLNTDFIKRFSISKKEVEEDIERTKRKIQKRIEIYTRGRKRSSMKRKTVILVDDGIASGYTMQNAADTAVNLGAKEVIIAVPTAPLSSINRLQPRVAAIVCPDIRDTAVFAVADAYVNWCDISTEGAVKYLEKYGYLK